MSVVSSAPPSFVAFAAFRRFTVAEYHKLIDIGFLNDEDKVELLEGYLVEKMSRNPPHDVASQCLNECLMALRPSGWVVRTQFALTLSDSEPEPDAVLARGDRRTFATRHSAAADVGLLIEVADSTLTRDRHDKGRIYARAAIAVYWVVNLVDQQIEVYTQPIGAEPCHFGQRQDYRLGDVIPIVLAGTQVAQLAVADILG